MQTVLTTSVTRQPVPGQDSCSAHFTAIHLLKVSLPLRSKGKGHWEVTLCDQQPPACVGQPEVPLVRGQGSVQPSLPPGHMSLCGHTC